MTLQRIGLVAIAVLLFTGCAHPIKVAPDLTRIERSSTTPSRIAAKVGYYIPVEESSIEVTTPGGGGDNVRYFPYRDIETGFQKMLSNVFTGVVKLTSIVDLPSIARDGIDFIIVPDVVTSSGGSGFFTWPPTNFTVDLTSTVRDPVGKVIASPRVVGTGSAGTGEKLSDHAIAGKRAMEDALLKMQAALFETKLQSAATDSRPTLPQSPAATSTSGDRLAHIKELKDRGLISQEEFEAKRKAIIDAL